MRKALLLRFMAVLALALAISSLITYYFVSHQLLNTNIDNLTNILHVVDYALHDGENVQEKLNELHSISFEEEIRITVMDLEGNVVADTKAQKVQGLENHLQRSEIQSALKDNIGHAMRYSQTLNTNMLYVAGMSADGDSVIRISVPYTDIFDYMLVVFPMLLLGMCVAFLISIVVTARFTDTITKPLRVIAEQMQAIHGRDMEFHAQTFQYEELNVISDTTVKLIKKIRAYIEKIEFERHIRQEFFSNASHELKTPITSVRGYAELMEAGFAQDEATKKDFLGRILKETENMTSLIDDILMISRLETKEAEVTFSSIRMSPLLKEVTQSLEPLAFEQGISLHTECEPIIIEASEKQLRELLMNLASNGMKYNHRGGNVWITVNKREGDMLITVKDDGMGIPKESQQRVFERFYRVDKGRSKKMGGTGLGLSIVKHIVEFYGGSICLDSKISKGSTFYIRIPMIKTEKNQEINQAHNRKV